MSTLIGTNGDDHIQGSYDADGIYGLDGDDTIDGLDGNDYISGGAGNDDLEGWSGRNLISGGDGNDTIRYGAYYGAAVSEAIYDTINGGAGTDTLVSGAGDDHTRIDLAAGTLHDFWGDGRIANVENVIGDNYWGDTIIGDDKANVLNGEGGGDVIHAGGGNDTIRGGGTLTDPTNSLDGGTGNDTVDYTGRGANLHVDLAAGTAAGDWGSDILANIENAIGIAGSADTIIGDAGANVLNGQGGGDTIEGGAGNDTLIGGAGANSLDGGAGIDSVDYSGAATAVSVDLAAGTASNSTIHDHLAGIEYVVGSARADVIRGDAANNRLTGGGGADRLHGGDGNDVFRFAAITDSQAGASDTINDFVQGRDRIDLQLIDANTSSGGNDGFIFDGTGSAPAAGHVSVYTSGGNTFVVADVDGNHAHDLVVKLTGIVALTAADFIL